MAMTDQDYRDWVEGEADRIMDYFLDGGHDVSVTTDAARGEITINLPDCEEIMIDLSGYRGD